MYELTEEEIKSTGIYQSGEIKEASVCFYPDIRTICEKNMCRNYAGSWACPPATGSFDECVKKCASYSEVFVFSALYKLKNSFDIQGMRDGHADFKKVCDALYELIKDKREDFMLLSNESCIRCEKCTYPDKPCRFPEKLFASIEGFGINVSQLAKAAGLSYNNGVNTVTYFGAVFYNK